MATTLKVIVAIVAAIVVGTSMDSNDPAKFFFGALFLITVGWLVAIAGGLGTIIRRDDGKYVKSLDDIDDEDPTQQPPRY